MPLFLSIFAPFHKHKLENVKGAGLHDQPFLWINEYVFFREQTGMSLLFKAFYEWLQYVSGGQDELMVLLTGTALYVRHPLCSLMSTPPSKEDNTSLWLMQHSFLLKSTLLDSPLVWVFCLDWRKMRGWEGHRPLTPKSLFLMLIPAEEYTQ